MAKENYRKALEDAEQEVVRLNLYRASVDRQLAQLKAAITALSILLEDPPKTDDPTVIGDVGITDAIRQVLKEAGVGLTPNQIKAKLLESEFDLSKYANSSAVIHNTLKRLETQEEVTPVRDSSGTTAYALYIDAGAINPQLARLDAYFEANRQMADKYGKLAIPQSVIDAMERPFTDAQAAVAKQIEAFDKVQREFLKKTGGFK